MARNKYPEETRNRIIETAGRLFIEKGYEHTSIQDIIDHLGGLSKGAIYHHFKSKEEIMYAVAEELYTDSTAQMQKIRQRRDLNGKEKIRALFQASIFSARREDMFTAGPDMLKNPQLLVKYFQESVQKEAPDIFRPILEEGIADGSIQTDSPKELAEVLILLGAVWINPLIYQGSRQDTIARMRFLQKLLLNYGLDVIDDSMIQRLETYCDIYETHKKE